MFQPSTGREWTPQEESLVWVAWWSFWFGLACGVLLFPLIGMGVLVVLAWHLCREYIRCIAWIQRGHVPESYTTVCRRAHIHPTGPTSTETKDVRPGSAT